MLFVMIPESDEGFQQFWSCYPKKVGKLDAQRAWTKAKKHGVTVEAILTALAWQVRSDQWQRGYVPNPSTYLNQGRWMDEPPSSLLAASQDVPCQWCGVIGPHGKVACNAGWLAREKARA